MACDIAQTTCLLGETLGFWIQTGAFVISALAAAGALFYNARQVKLLREQSMATEKQARSRATIDVALHEKTDQTYKTARRKYASLREKKDTSLTTYACGNGAMHQEEKQAILLVLNNYEFMAAGIRCGAFDEEMYKRMSRSLLVRDWDSLSAFVHELRRTEERPALFVELEWLAGRWR